MKNLNLRVLFVLLLLLVVAIAGSTYFKIIGNKNSEVVVDTDTASSSQELPAVATSTVDVSSSTEQIISEPDAPVMPEVPKSVENVPKIYKPTFSGTLEEVNTGCFSDGECYVVVDGKHVTVLRGWSRDTVGQVIGEDGIGGLESHIGAGIDVYASSTGINSFTLYGDANYYIKLNGKKGTGKPDPVQSNVGAGCMIGGCSSQLCVAEGSGQVVSTCIYKEEYACYKTARCEKQSTGQCGWTPSEELKMCISSKS